MTHTTYEYYSKYGTNKRVENTIGWRKPATERRLWK